MLLAVQIRRYTVKFLTNTVSIFRAKVIYRHENIKSRQIKSFRQTDWHSVLINYILFTLMHRTRVTWLRPLLLRTSVRNTRVWAGIRKLEGSLTHKTENRSITAVHRAITGHRISFYLSHFNAEGKLKLVPHESDFVTDAICLDNFKAGTTPFRFRRYDWQTRDDALEGSTRKSFVLIPFAKVNLSQLRLGWGSFQAILNLSCEWTFL
jgi:hypothetical protein